MLRFNEDLLEELAELEIYIPVPAKAFAMATKAKKDDYESMSISEAVDLIILLSQIKE